MFFKKTVLVLALIGAVQMSVPSAKADLTSGMITLASYMATSSTIVAVCLATDEHSVAECLLMGTIVTAITLDAYDKQMIQQAAEDAASLLATKEQPSEFLGLVFDKMREEMRQQGMNPSNEDLAYSVLATADSVLKK